jgi:hypothetical protein
MSSRQRPEASAFDVGPLSAFFQDLLVRKDSGQPLDTWILIADKARTPHRSLRRRLRGGTKKKQRRPNFLKSASTSHLECEDDSDLIPAQWLQARWNPSTKDRWNPTPESAPVMMRRRSMEQKVIEESPISVAAFPPRDATPTMPKPRRRPSNGRLSPPPPPLFTTNKADTSTLWTATPPSRSTLYKYK